MFACSHFNTGSHQHTRPSRKVIMPRMPSYIYAIMPDNANIASTSPPRLPRIVAATRRRWVIIIPRHRPARPPHVQTQKPSAVTGQAVPCRKRNIFAIYTAMRLRFVTIYTPLLSMIQRDGRRRRPNRQFPSVRVSALTRCSHLPHIYTYKCCIRSARQCAHTSAHIYKGSHCTVIGQQRERRKRIVWVRVGEKWVGGQFHALCVFPNEKSLIRGEHASEVRWRE